MATTIGATSRSGEHRATPTGAERGVRRGDTLAGAFVEDVRAAGFDVVSAPTTRNPRHARIIETAGSFDDPESLEMLSIAFDKLARAHKSNR